jgi:hypothetical protein
VIGGLKQMGTKQRLSKSKRDQLAKVIAYPEMMCFSLFSAMTFYKGITGVASCGCFGSVHVNPWITFLAIDQHPTSPPISLKATVLECCWKQL